MTVTLLLELNCSCREDAKAINSLLRFVHAYGYLLPPLIRGWSISAAIKETKRELMRKHENPRVEGSVIQLQCSKYPGVIVSVGLEELFFL